MVRYFVFVGVTTGQSSIMRVFPRWRERLGLPVDTEILGVDLPLHAPKDRYREVVEQIKSDPQYLGALVTTHKLDLYAASCDLFDEVDRYAALCGEVSAIGKRGWRLLGWATDPFSAGRALAAILGSGYFGRTGAEVQCFGAGGAGLAISLLLMTRPAAADRPRRIMMTDRDLGRLEHLRSLHARLDSDVTVEYVHVADAEEQDRLLARLPPASLVINATGMGKDLPGSPIGPDALLPERAVAWELNYRGDLQFLRTARSQEASRGVRAHDGWYYFILGWAAVMEKVFERLISDEEIRMLSEDAEFARV